MSKAPVLAAFIAGIAANCISLWCITEDAIAVPWYMFSFLIIASQIWAYAATKFIVEVWLVKEISACKNNVSVTTLDPKLRELITDLPIQLPGIYIIRGKRCNGQRFQHSQCL